jgi:hypothetical protein
MGFMRRSSVKPLRHINACPKFRQKFAAPPVRQQIFFLVPGSGYLI